MRETITPHERLFLAVLILSGLCANSYYTYSPEYHVVEAVRVLDKLLDAIDEAQEVK